MFEGFTCSSVKSTTDKAVSLNIVGRKSGLLNKAEIKVMILIARGIER